MSISLHVELKKLHQIGVLELRRDPKRHREGEGAYCFKGRKIAILSNVTGPLPGQDEVSLEQPHDVAWCEHTKTFLAAAPSGEPAEFGYDA